MDKLGRLKVANKLLGSEVGSELGKAGSTKCREDSSPL